MEPYITFKDTDANNQVQYYILQRQFPHYVAVILEYPKDNVLVQVPVSGHNLFVTFSGVLQGNFVPMYKDVYDEVVAAYQHMAEWFYVNRVLVDPKRYKKFKI